MRRIATKTQFYDRWRQGVLGNRPRTWHSEDELLASGYTGTVSVRYRLPGNTFTGYRVPVGDVPLFVAAQILRGAERSRFTFNESMPDHRLVLQGELARLPEWDLRYDTAPVPMRQAMAQARTAVGSAALTLLRWALDGNSYDDVMALLELYPDHVVEFSAYDHVLGDLPGRNTVIWEVRAY